MRIDKTAYSWSMEIPRRIERSPDRISLFLAPNGESPKRQGKRPPFAGYLHHCLTFLLTALLVVGLWASPATADDNDYPHNSYQGMDCYSCHFNGLDGDAICLACHDGSSATKVATHSSVATSTKYGTWAMACIDCHDPHIQDQYWYYAPDSVLVTGTSDPGGITENTLTMTGAGWAEDSLAGMILFPNVDGYPQSDYYNFKIVSNTSDTITVKGTMGLGVTGTGGTAFAVIYGKLINYAVVTPNSGTKVVHMYRATGPNSFADGDSTYDGICEVCHTKTNHHRNNGGAPEQSHNDGTRCTTCHTHANGFGGLDHTAAGVVLPVSACLECHGSAGTDLVGSVHHGECGLCHVDPAGGGPLVEPLESTVPNGGNCINCHGTLSEAHPGIQHTAAPGSGPIVLFADDDHDDAGWTGDKPYFQVTVNCAICHNTDLPTLHGGDCATCHPTPYDTLGTWDGGCQQGGCHPAFHAGSITAHLPFADAYDPANDCTRCHDSSTWDVPQSNCLNCHASYQPGSTTLPTTTSNAQPEYDGPAEVSFSIRENGKVAIGRTFYRLDGGTETAAGKSLVITEPGPHHLAFWSRDQAGNLETQTNEATFTIFQDSTPPTTTSDAKVAYSQGGVITLTATDDGTRGVKTTYYRLNGGPVQTGTTVVIPATSGVISYTLSFWSEDWAGNVETEHLITFTVTSGTGTIRLVWWDCDLYPSQKPTGTDKANWIVYKDHLYGPVVATGSGASPGWNGINDIPILIGSSQKYYVRINWWDSYEGFYEITDIPNVYVTTPGQTVRLSY